MQGLEMNNPLVVKFADTTALAAERVIIEAGFTFRKCRVFAQEADEYPELVFDRNLSFDTDGDEVAAIAGGIQTEDLAGDIERNAKTSTTGIDLYTGGERIGYDDAETPTYKKLKDGSSVTAATIKDRDGDVLSRELPALSSARSDLSSKDIITKYGIKLPTSANNTRLRRNGKVIVVEFYA